MALARGLGTGKAKPADAADGSPPGPVSEFRLKVLGAFGATFTIFIADRLIQVCLLAVLARNLTPSQFGVAAAATLYVSLLTLFSQLGAAPAVVQAYQLGPRTLSSARFVVAVSSVAFFVLMQACAPLAGVWFRNPDVINATRALSFVCLLQALISIQHAYVARQLRARDLALIELGSEAMGTGLVAVPMAIMGWGYWALIYGAIAGAVARVVLLAVFAAVPRFNGVDMVDVRYLLSRGPGFLLTIFLQRVAAESDRIIVGRYLSVADLGFYSRANGLMALPSTLFGAVIERVAFPAFSKLQLEAERIRNAYLQTVSLTALIGLPLTVFIVLMGADIIRFVLGPAWEAAIAPFNILSVATYFRLSDRVGGTLLRSVGRPYHLARIQAALGGLTIGGSIWAAQYGISHVAAAIMTVALISYLMITVSAVRATQLGLMRFLGAHRSGCAMALATFAAVAPVRLISGIQGWPPFANLVVAGVVAALVAGVCALGAPKIFLGPAAQGVAVAAMSMVRGKLRPRSKGAV